MKKLPGRIVLPPVALLALLAASLESSPATAAGKELYLPARIDRVPADNDFEDPESEFSFKRMVQGENIALFWAREYGEDPTANPDRRRRFDPAFALEECERFHACYVDELKMVVKGQSLADQYKMLVIVFGGDDGTAYGGGADEKVGILWTPAVRINRPPYGALAHEMAHCFQYLSRIDSGRGATGAIIEMSAQYLLWQVYPEWMTFENYHLVDFMKQTHLAFLHPANMYHSPYVLEYWSNRHGRDFLGKLFRSTEDGEDPVMTYQRLHGLSQEQFNDEMFDASRRFITWDLDRVRDVAKRYANQHACSLEDVGDGWYRIAPANCPQDYGYNGIRLTAPAAGTVVALEFKGLAGADGFGAVQVDQAGWRYGFLAFLEDGRRVYGEVHRAAEGTATFTVPEQTEHLWLVVSGAPTGHSPVAMGWGRRRGGSAAAEAQWPYQIRLSGTGLDDAFVLASAAAGE